MRFMQIRALVLDCFRDALDRKIFWVMLGISLMICGAMACISFDATGIRILFGLWHMDNLALSTSNPQLNAIIGIILSHYIGNHYVGWIGIILGLVTTAGIFPSLMERGAIEAVLAKPISRPTVFFGKYLGAMAFMTLQVTIFVTLSFFVVAFRWNYWQPAYFWCIPLTVLLFSYVYCFSAYFGIKTRSAMSALLLSVLAWIAIAIPQYTYKTLLSLPAMGIDLNPAWIKACDIGKSIFPRTTDIPYIAGRLLGVATSSPDFEVTATSTSVTTTTITQTGQPTIFSPDLKRLEEVERKLANVNFAKSIGVSLLFEAVIVSMALWKFCRNDY